MEYGKTQIVDTTGDHIQGGTSIHDAFSPQDMHKLLDLSDALQVHAQYLASRFQ